jgi:hypothetical protein
MDNSVEGLKENAKLMDVSLCVSQDVKDVIHCLDGIKVISTTTVAYIFTI